MAARARRRDASGGGSGADFDEEALRWVLFLGIGCVGVAAGLMHTVFARQAAKAIGWETSPFQYEVGFANLGVGLAAIYAAVHDSSEAWVTTSIAAGTFPPSRGSITSARSSRSATSPPATR